MAKGLYLEQNGIWYIDKVINGVRLRQSTGERGRLDAERVLDVLCQRYRGMAVSEAWLDQCRAMYADEKSWLHTTHRSILYRTRRQKRSACLTLDELRGLLELTNGSCQVTGIPFSNERPAGCVKAPPFIMSVDRIDSKLDYQTHNCRIVCLAVNLAMREWGEDVIVRIGKAMVLKLLQPHVAVPFVALTPLSGDLKEKRVRR